jgi:xanthine/CO dehydrogenase XdhC/CoxF family maturation factor
MTPAPPCAPPWLRVRRRSPPSSPSAAAVRVRSARRWCSAKKLFLRLFVRRLHRGRRRGPCLACLADGQPRRLVYGEGSPWPDIRLLCGARIEILVEKIEPDDAAVRTLLRPGRAVRFPAFWVSDGETRQCMSRSPWPVARAPSSAPMIPFRASRCWAATRPPWPWPASGSSAASRRSWSARRVRPPRRPWRASTYSRDAVDDALADLGLDAWTAVAVCGHDIEIDHAALLAALPSPAPYVGLLGARRRLPERIARLKAAGPDRAATSPNCARPSAWTWAARRRSRWPWR